MIRTRFAPSPTGYLHIGGARTALFCWAYARKHGGKFILRIEDTDLERSTAESTQAILDSMQWLGLDWDEGPVRQMDRLDRYRAVAEQLIRDGHAYRCYASKEELDALREQQRARGEKPRYDGRWRPENAKGKTPPAGVTPVVRFRNPDDGDVVWRDLVKGEIRFANAELDDLVLMRADGVPTYNFGVVVDDLDMAITHVIRGDDHVNNTPRQINIYRALGPALPAFAHVPMILGADGERLSKRHGAVSVLQYRDDGYLPEALVNFLARLGWSHGDEEMFSTAQLVEWFDLEHVSRSPAQFNGEKLAWLNQQYLKAAAPERLAELVAPRIAADGGDPARGPSLVAGREAPAGAGADAERAGRARDDVLRRHRAEGRAPRRARDRRGQTRAARAGRALRDRRAVGRGGDPVCLRGCAQGARTQDAEAGDAVARGRVRNDADAVALSDARPGGQGARAGAPAALRLGKVCVTGQIRT